MRVLQLNLNHCQATQDLLSQIICETRVDVAIICEQYKDMHSSVWVKDVSGKAAIWACGNMAIEEISAIPEEGFVKAKIGGIYIYSCYARPSASIDQYERMLDRLVRDASQHNPKIVAGDFNAWAVEWGSRITNRRGRILLEAIAGCDLVLANKGNKPTFMARGFSSVVDITFMNASLVRDVEWAVAGYYTHSDHQAIIFSTSGRSMANTSASRHKPEYVGWASKKLDKAAFIQEFTQNTELSGTALDKAHQVISRLKRACDNAMPRRRVNKNWHPNYWWNSEISDLRTKCFKARRKTQRSRERDNFEENYREYKVARKEFQNAILRSKRNCFRQICQEADSDPWGKAYRVVTSKLKGLKSPQPSCPLLMEKIVETLFPEHRCNGRVLHRVDYTEAIPLVTKEELNQIARKLGDRKAPGPDGVPNIALKLAIEKTPNMFIEMFTQCLREGIFPEPWKKQSLVLIPKPNKPLGDPSAYRPICLLDTLGKILEKIICNRLLPIVETRGGLSNSQYGFRKARSTIDAIGKVTEIARTAIEMKGARRKYCAIITLDVRNAFNSANWSRIIQTLLRLGAPNYLMSVISSYFTNRKLCYSTNEGTKTYNVSAGVPQGSVLGPLLWNIMYNDVLTLDIPEEATVIGFADDIAVTVTARYIEEIELIANEVIHTIGGWMKNAGLELAEHKTEMVLVTSRRKLENIKVRVGGCEVVSKPYLKYLGVIIDARLNFRAHMEYTSQKASKVRMAIERMMPNIGGPRQSKRKIVSTVVSSLILYAAPVWSEALKVKSTARKVLSVYRMCALRICSSYRTTSEEAAYVISGMIPLDILADEATRLYERKRSGEQNTMGIRKLEREQSLRLWQSRWERSLKGRWTFKLIPNIDVWVNRKRGEVNYYLTQFISGHGGYRGYLHRFGLNDSPYCPYCPTIVEDPEHLMFHCPRYGEVRRRTEHAVGQQLRVDNVVDILLSGQENWDAICYMVKYIHMELKKEEDRRKYPQHGGG